MMTWRVNRTSDVRRVLGASRVLGANLYLTGESQPIAQILLGDVWRTEPYLYFGTTADRIEEYENLTGALMAVVADGYPLPPSDVRRELMR